MKKQISIEIEEEDHEKFLRFCEEVGIPPQSCFNVFIKRVIMDNEIPFDIENTLAFEEGLLNPPEYDNFH